MSLDHLRDEQIQEFLDGNTAAGDEAARNHLRTCSECRMILLEYRRLAAELERMPAWEPAPDLARIVIDRLPDRKRWPSRAVRAALAIAAGLALLAALVWRLDPRLINSAAGAVAGTFAPVVKACAPWIERLLGWLDGGGTTLIAAVLALLGVAIADRLLGPKILKASGARR